VRHFRLIALLALAAGIAIAFVWRQAVDPAAIRDAIVAHPLAPAIFVALQVAASLLFVPRTVLSVAAGLIFGLYWGTLWALLGAMLGAAAGFAFVRWFGATGMLDTSPGIGRLVERAESGGWRSVAIFRLMPVPHSVANTLLAMTNLSWRNYLIGSFAGMLPMTVVQVDIGASGVALMGGGQWQLATLTLAAGIAATFLLKRWGSQPHSDKLD
jgi:uncharacterized membrane protein YdjX (TVP38/TMEM64 family)